ncbi:hypothetical protein BDV33DRAFT_203409 [Aspergillus novoparasiticus]|uniref:Apple domain-containing protein n=1 Tax=Aspergillus novoparasiticus TaxID=986946 RepID=A0A5N6EV59_9EURO|nr:hypothetical protein BDV33DRAFT_203409 [Aspergillus novoparasiticus]
MSTSLSGAGSYNACCSGSKTNIGQLKGDGDTHQVFQYTCGSYIVENYSRVPGLVHNARSCMEACEADSSCQAGAWDWSSSLCFVANTANLQYASDPDNTFLRFEKLDESSTPPLEHHECEDQVADAVLSCETEQQGKCQDELNTQEKDLHTLCEQRIQDQCGSSVQDGIAEEKCNEEKATLEKSLRSECEIDKSNALKQWKQDQAAKDQQSRKLRDELEAKVKQLQKQEEESKKRAEKDRNELEKLQRDNQQLQQRLDQIPKQPPVKQPPSKQQPRQPPKPPAINPAHEIPPLTKWRKCSDMEGQEYTVMGVTYTVFCGMHPPPHSQVNQRNDWTGVDPSFMMAMCSTTSDCQGVKVRQNGAQLTYEHEFPPSNRVHSTWWSLVPKEPHTGISNSVTDIRSQIMDDEGRVKCPEVDGEIIRLGEQAYQLNCNKSLKPQRRRTVPGVKLFNECLVRCFVSKGCQGVTRDNGCSLIYSHHALPKETPEEDLTNGDSWIAMLTEA